MRRKKRRSALHQTTRDIAHFGMGSMVVGGLGAATGAIGHGAAGGLAGMSAMLPATGQIVMMKGQVGMLGEAMKSLPKYKKKKQRWI